MSAVSGRKPRVLDVGNCDPDHAAIRRLLDRFDTHVDRVMFVDEAMAALRESTYDLVLVNRLVFADSSDGLELVTRMQADPQIRDTPVMMISNFADAQQRAVAAGARPGFGKSALDDPRTMALLSSYLGAPVPHPR
ncbi:MAG: response regulator [Phycisphaerales bacterium]|nr:response regulator [Phycisphaerales bacterium]